MKYQAYPEYKDSGVEWLGDVPEHWKTPCLRWYINIASGEGLSNTDFDKVYDGVNRFRVIGGNGTLGYSAQFNTSSKAFAIGRVGALCGNIHFINEICWITDNALKLSAWVEVHDHYFFFLLKAAKLNEYASITAQPLITGEQVKALRIVIPPIREQQNIANFLDHETAKIDTLIEKQQQLIKLLKEKRQAVISHAVTKGLNPNAPMRDSGVEWLGEVPEYWVVGRYKFCTTRIVVGIAEAATQAYADTGVPIIRSTNIREEGLDTSGMLFITEQFAEKNESKYLYADDVITVRTGYPGISAVIPDFLNKSQCFTNLVATPSKGILPDFLAEYLNSHTGKSYFDLLGWGSAQKNISVPILQNIPIAYPTEIEQFAVVKFVKEQREKFTYLVEKAEKQIELLIERRTALISAAVTGKIDVRNWQAPKTLYNNNEISKEEAA